MFHLVVGLAALVSVVESAADIPISAAAQAALPGVECLYFNENADVPLIPGFCAGSNMDFNDCQPLASTPLPKLMFVRLDVMTPRGGYAVRGGKATPKCDGLFARCCFSPIKSATEPVPLFQFGEATEVFDINKQACPLAGNSQFFCSMRTSTGPATPEFVQGMQLAHGSYWNGEEEPNALFGVMPLATVRDWLTTNCLHDPYFDNPTPEKYHRVDGSTDPEPVCDEDSIKYRSADGSCYDKRLPLMGARGTRMGRATSKNGPKDNHMPPEKDVAELMSGRKADASGFIRSPYLNIFGAVWLQMNIHDWFNHKDSPKGADKAAIDPSLIDDKGHTWNDVTHWWDGSQIYGSSLAEQKLVRLGKRGKLKVDEAKQLLQATGGVPRDTLPLTGFNDNWWLALEAIQTLFVLEHNRIAELLIASEPLRVRTTDADEARCGSDSDSLVGKPDDCIDDEVVFQLARLCVSASLAKIHTAEWTPAVLPNPTFRISLNVNWGGINLNPQEFPGQPGYFVPVEGLQDNPATGLNESTFVDVRTLLTEPGIRGIGKEQFLPTRCQTPSRARCKWHRSETDDAFTDAPAKPKLSPHYMPEEFTSIYRLHSLLPERMSVVNARSGQVMKKDLSMADAIFSKSHELISTYGLENVLYSLGTQGAGHLTLQNYPFFLTNFEKFGKTVNMAATDVFRDRERGVPRYNEFRRMVGLKVFTHWENVTSNEEHLRVLKKLYGDDEAGLNNCDMLPCTLAEEPRPCGFGFSETTNQLFILVASRRVFSDPYLQERFTETFYTATGINYVKRVSMGSIIAAHFPRLAEHMNNGASPFYYWLPLGYDPRTKQQTDTEAPAWKGLTLADSGCGKEIVPRLPGVTNPDQRPVLPGRPIPAAHQSAPVCYFKGHATGSTVLVEGRCVSDAACKQNAGTPMPKKRVDGSCAGSTYCCRYPGLLDSQLAALGGSLLSAAQNARSGELGDAEGSNAPLLGAVGVLAALLLITCLALAGVIVMNRRNATPAGATPSLSPENADRSYAHGYRRKPSSRRGMRRSSRRLNKEQPNPLVK